MDFRVAVKGFIVKDNKLLILKRTKEEVQKPNIWEIPGGRLELGEDPFQGLKREVKEEAGIDIEILRPLSVRHFTRDDGQVITMIIFLCKVFDENIILSKEHCEFEWINIESAKEKLAEFFHKEVEMYEKWHR